MRFRPKHFQTRVTLALVLASLVPLALVGGFFFSLLDRNINADTRRQLAFARDAEASEINHYLTFVQREAKSVAFSAMVRYAAGDFYGFGFGFDQAGPTADQAATRLRRAFGLDGPTPPPDAALIDDRLLNEALDYANVWRRFHGPFVDFIGQSEFDNIYLVNAQGRVVYATQPDDYLGFDLTTSQTQMGRLYARLGDQPAGDRTPILADFADDPVSGGFGALLGFTVPLYNAANATIVFRLPPDGLAGLIGSDRSVVVLQATGKVIAANEVAGLRPGQTVALPGAMTAISTEDAPLTHVAALDRGLADEPTLSAWTHLPPPAPDWLVVAETTQAHAFAASRSLRTALLVIAALAVAVLLPLALWLARSITGPMRQLASKSLAIADGALDEDLPQYSRPLEYADLSRAVRKMRDGLRHQLDLIRDKNVELEGNIAKIAEKNAALEAADRMKDQFLAATSHELRTPLNGIIGISETLGAGALGEIAPAQKSQLQLIALSARRLSRLVDDLLDIYRIREGRMRLDLQPLDIGECLTGAIDLARPMLSGEGVALHLSVAAGLPPAQADPMRVEQILFNLLSNALKYGDGSRIEITATALPGADGTKLAIAIRDFGPGISPDSLERIFHPLEQITGAHRRTQAHQGWGLGLTIARNLAQLMGGTIQVDSALGAGSTFTLLLPASAQALPAARAADALDMVVDPALQDPAPATDTDRGAPTILIVDDEPVNLQVLKNVLLPQGYRLLECDNGPQALRLVETERPDLVVLDVMMAGMDGLEVARRLRRRHDLLDLPIILLTARGRSRDMIDGFEAGANDYVVKPFVRDELLSRIGTLLRAASAHHRAEENLALKQEIQRRVQVEDALRLSQRRMGQLLDTLEDGLICVSPQGQVTYANAAAARHLGAPVTAGVTLLPALLPPEMQSALIDLPADDEIHRIPGQIAGRAVLMHAFALLPESGGGLALLLGNADRDRPDLPGFVRDAVDSSITALALAREESTTTATNGAQDRQDPLRAEIVGTMVDVLALWRLMTGKGKVEFAEVSGLWRVSVDKSTLQTRTLDKYLLIETLPANPRWRDVIRSADFVLDRAATPADECAEIAQSSRSLIARLARLRRLLPVAG